MARRKKKSDSVKVNFKGVESRSTPAEGDYPFKVLEATAGKSGNNNEQIEVVAEVFKGENKGFKGYIYFPLQENSLWKLHAFLTAIGEEIPDEEMDIDLSDLVDKEFVGVLTHETYNGRKRAKLTDFDSIDNYDGADDDKKGGKKSASKKSAGKKADKISRSDVEEMDEEELQELLEKHDLEDEVDLDDHKKLPKKVAAVLEALEEADLLDGGDGDEDEDEDEKPKGKKSSKKSKKDADEDEDEEDEKPKGKKSSKGGKDKKSKKPKKIDKSDVEDMDEDELQELIDEHGLDVDLDDYKKLPKKVAAVVEALDDEDLLNDDD